MFDHIVVVDWSSRPKPSPRAPTKDAIFVSHLKKNHKVDVQYHRTRSAAMDVIYRVASRAIAQNERVLCGFDFGFGYPRGFARALTGQDNALAVWDWLNQHIEDGDDNSNNRFEVADLINKTLGFVGPFWGCPASQQTHHLRQKGTERDTHPFAEKRTVEALCSGAQPMWKLFTPGAVGAQSLVGLPRLAQMRRHFGDALDVWPVQTGFTVPSAPIVLAEVFPSLDDASLRNGDTGTIFDIKDARQVRATAEALGAMQLAQAFTVEGGDDAQQEGWILGVRPALQAPRLSNDCFALPQGVNWTPVSEALAHLRSNMVPIVETQSRSIQNATGCVLAKDVHAKRSNPQYPNTAVDGYGFAFDSLGAETTVLDLVEGRAAAGGAFEGVVPHGKAIRVLTGAVLPEGVDTVVLEEDCNISDTQVAFKSALKRGANCRKAGEDMMADDIVGHKGRRLTAADLARLTAAGIGAVEVFRPLKVAVISTGDELLEAGSDAHGTFDANRPMLLSMLRTWGFDTIDVGIVPDEEHALRNALDRAARADAIITSGGASAGDEDHMSRVLNETGSMALWRIAMKPGRPLAMGMWAQTPVFGLPGNPVAAFVCSLIFARPALMQLAGGAWTPPQGFSVPAGFAKNKKAGRREYLRARIREGRAEVYHSEGSGRISGLSWAEGLVELPDDAATIQKGDLVTYYPFGSFDLN
ncbi:gephyrin-like molybdotransferase Glp [Nereida sp. MMG025]|uniref:molybdopterin-binding protein n=1 Tax=Nereida sp. MMG025 TaxID=2909981 RepID=UPI001F38F8D6|nr:gephyrin-like molybdotransferase Glp [Nereida sp. MMG025]MCF6444367.1 molybdopterin-binding protein [Nereida sp. MMG025]